MFKQSAAVLGRRVVRPSFLVRSHHLANLKSAGIPDQRNESPKTLEDGSVGVIHVQGHESATLANPMQRRFLNDLELQQNRWLKEEKKSQDDLGSLTKQITMSMAPGKGPWSNKGGDKKKKEAEAKKKCDEMAQKKKCEEAAKKAKADKKKKEQKSKCKAMAEKEKCGKMAQKEAKKKEAEKKKKEAAKCKEMAQKEKCAKLAKEDKGKKC